MKRQEFVRRVCRGVLSAMACVAMATGVARAATIDITLSNIVQNRTLQSGYIYRFTESVEYNAPAGENALRVADGATVTLTDTEPPEGAAFYQIVVTAQ